MVSKHKNSIEQALTSISSKIMKNIANPTSDDKTTNIQ